ncbi:MAG: Spy/CpxP family protein refolding chaperone [Gemmatimonas sp.]
MRFTKHQLLALILGAGMTSTLQAQGARRAGGRQLDSARVAERLANRGAGRPMVDSARMAEMAARRAEGNSPAGQILAQREKLGLTDDQVNRLEALKTSFASKEIAPAEMQKLREELATASRGEANIEAARAALARMSAAQNEVVIARLVAHNEARAVLNADQQAQLDAAEARRPGAMMGAAGFGAGGSAGRGGPGGPGARGRGGPPAPVPPL